MQYFVSVIDDRPTRPRRTRWPPSTCSTSRLEAEGHWVFAGGLAAPSSATVIDNRGGEAMVTDGPFLESKEYLAGFWIIGPLISTWRSSSLPRGRRPATGKVEVRPFL